MTEKRTEIFSIQFDVDNVVMAYMNIPNDVRVEGQVGLQHQIRIDLGHPDYAEDADLLRRQAQRMLANALEDFHNSEPWNPEDDEDDEDEQMGGPIT